VSQLGLGYGRLSASRQLARITWAVVSDGLGDAGVGLRGALPRIALELGGDALVRLATVKF
jgi:hypothetical protein